MKTPILKDPCSIKPEVDWGLISTMIEGESHTSGVLLHQGPHRNVLAITVAIRKVGKVRYVQAWPLIPVERRRDPEIAVLYRAVNHWFEVEVVLRK